MNLKCLNLAADELLLIAAILTVTSIGIVIKFINRQEEFPPVILAPKYFSDYCLKSTITYRLTVGTNQNEPENRLDSSSYQESNHNENLVYSSENIHYNISYPIDINHANQYQLEALPGIGPVIASRIIEYRNEIGIFSCKEDIIGVKGIGPVKFSRIESLITVSDYQNLNLEESQ